MSMENVRWFEAAWSDLSLEDLYDLLQLRQIVFIKEQNCPFVDADGKDKGAIHLWARDESGRMVACARYAGAGYFFEEASIGRIVSHPEMRGTGLGKELVKRSIERLFWKFGSQPIRIGAQKYLTGFYGSFGFEATGEIYLEDGIEHVEMLRP